jgi:hypothetical protein
MRLNQILDYLSGPNTLVQLSFSLRESYSGVSTFRFLDKSTADVTSKQKSEEKGSTDPDDFFLDMTKFLIDVYIE